MQSGDHAIAVPSLQKSTTDRLRPVQVPGWFRAGFRVAGALAPGAAARLARRLFFTPPRAAMRPEERAVLHGILDRLFRAPVPLDGIASENDGCAHDEPERMPGT